MAQKPIIQKSAHWLFNNARVLRYLIYAIILILVFTHKGTRNFFKNRMELKKLNKLENSVDREYVKLQEEKERILNDKKYLERLARIELDMIKPGELEFRFPPPQKEKNENAD